MQSSAEINGELTGGVTEAILMVMPLASLSKRPNSVIKHRYCD
jgi:hypothetical protein